MAVARVASVGPVVSCSPSVLLIRIGTSAIFEISYGFGQGETRWW